MTITLKQQKEYITQLVIRYRAGEISQKRALSCIGFMGDLVPELRNYAIEAVIEVGATK
jgi:hypothetical protein